MTRIAIISNCQTAGLANAAGQLLPDAEIDAFNAHELADQFRRREILDSLQGYDRVWLLPLGQQYGDFAEDKIRDRLSNVTIIPSLLFFGFHPDITYLPQQGRHLASPLGEYHSAIVIAAFLNGLTVQETTCLFNRLVYAKLGYFARYDAEIHAMVEAFDRRGIDIRATLLNWQHRGEFMYSPNHPRSFVLHDLTRLIITTAGLGTTAQGDPDALDDTLAKFPRFPTYPELAQKLGMAGSLDFRPMEVPGQPTVEIPLDEFIRGSFDAYTTISSAILRRTAGIGRVCELFG